MAQQKGQDFTEQDAQNAISTVELLAKINTIAAICRRSGLGFLAGQKPALSGDKDAVQVGVGNPNPDDFVAIVGVNFPNAKEPNLDNGETQGTFSYVTNRKYPMRGFQIAETVHTLSMFKRMFRSTLEGLAKHKFSTLLMALFFPKVLSEIVFGMFDGFARGMDKHQFKEERYCRVVREIRRVFKKMLDEDGYMELADFPTPKNRQEKLANIARWERTKPLLNIMDSVSALLEFDDAYRYRIQWLFKYDGQSKVIAKNPIRELSKMFGVLEARESDVRLRKQWRVFKLAVWGLIISPKAKKQIKRFFNELNDGEMVLQIEDKYHAVSKDSFDFGLPPQKDYH